MASSQVESLSTETVTTSNTESPEARKIRGQVEYYFSDENLRTDLHLLQCCNGRENEPVSISRICGWRKMRQYKKRDVIEALKNSQKLSVTEDGKKVYRKVPLTGPCLLDPDFKVSKPVKQKGGPADASEEVKEKEAGGNEIGDDDEIAYDPRTKRQIAHPLKPISQDKKKYPPGMSKNMMKPTGFEENFVEGPRTPAEAKEEEAMYDPDKPFVERIEIAIQRFKQKRRMHEKYSKVFNKWMKFGGIEFQPRMFGSVTEQEKKDMTAEEIARATATHHVPWDRQEKDKWVVDFVGVAEAFFSSFYPAQYGNTPSEVKNAAQVLRSFYNYILTHSVCDEYHSEILEARKLCDKAETELPQSYAAGLALPGSFNVAASTLLGEYYADAFVESGGWGADIEEYERLDAAVGMSKDEAKATFETAIDCLSISDGVPSDSASTESSSPTKLRAVEMVQTMLEVVDIQSPTEDCKAAYTKAKARFENKCTLEPLGKLVCKTFYTNEYKDYDLPPGQDPPNMLKEPKEYVFWVEAGVLNECYPGLKMDASVMTVELGNDPATRIHVLDQVKEAFCSFYKVLPNELWEARKAPRFKLLNKGLEDVMPLETDKEKGKEMEDGEMSDDFDE